LFDSRCVGVYVLRIHIITKRLGPRGLWQGGHVSINYIPNDPLAASAAPPMRRKTPRANRPASRATFQFFDVEPEGLASPGTTQFLFWQAREAALTTLAAWETAIGSFTRWEGNRKTIPFVQNAVVQLGAQPTPNAFYNRASFQFFESTARAKTTFSGESTDVVAHEIGHGVLDAIRPQLIESQLLEVGGFHEAFGDCVALVTALLDLRSRTAVRPSLGARNFLETTAEDLSDAIRRIQATHNAAEPRHARNTLKWQLPATLPLNGGPGVLINEEHSFARIFSGSFYDLIVKLAGTSPTAAAIRTAAIKAARLLVAAAASAPIGARFFQAVGRAMVLADDSTNGGANRELIKAAFAGHGVLLGTSAMLAPVAALAGPEPTLSATKAGLSAGTRRDVAARLGAARGARTAVHVLNIGDERVARMTVERDVSIGSVHASLKGCVVRVTDSVLVGSSGKRAAMLGALPDVDSTTEEVLSYVDSLVKHERILTKRPAKVVKRHRLEPMTRHTHEVVRIGGRKELKRRAFACRCCAGS
jgi:Fungalysin metallopeptidase (M36)